MWWGVDFPHLPRVPLPRPRVVPWLARPRATVALFFAAGGGGLVADVLASSVVRPKVAQLFVLDVPLFRATGILPFWVLDSGTVYVAEGGALVRFSASSALR